MKYTDLTQEQKDGITPYLRIRLELINKLGISQRKAYQQAQKAEIKFLETVMWNGRNLSELGAAKIIERKNKLIFESELK